ncbi:hypothetical protein J7J90_04105 [Candidatus Micrarchaeota archaeon]|nr:hypothetical protein [Candidatus Micrarchaeota archaeon]
MSVNINIDDEVYKKIKKFKKDKSFSEVLREMLSKRSDVNSTFGILKSGLDYKLIKKNRRDRNVNF